ncbi:MAG: nuclear transport factor 2 family protein [Chitinophagaceae bacterium]
MNKSKKTEQELLHLNSKYDSALVQNNVTVLDSIYADDFIYTTPDDEVRNKEQELTLIKKGELKLDWGKSEDVRVKVYDNAAVVTGMFLAKGVFRNNIIDIRERYSSFWVKKDKRWQMVAEQGNFIKSQ